MPLLGRTASDWAKLGIFYILFYSFLAAFWAVCFSVFSTQFLSDEKPRWTGSASLIGTSPGVAMRPFRRPKNLREMNKIHFSPNNKSSYGSWTQEIDEFLKPYNQPTSNFTLDMLGPCGISPYGYNESRPCIYLKLNKIYNVTNTPCDLTENQAAAKNTCSEMPESLQNVVKNADNSNQVWIECRARGKNSDGIAIDITTLDFKYFPSTQGFQHKDGQYYPYLRQKGYLSPLVAVQITPQKNEESKIRCRTYAQNIVYSQKDKLGYVEFSLFLVEEDHP